MANTKAKVATANLAFWESLIDVCDTPKHYLKRNEVVYVTGNTIVYGGVQGDKEYYKVQHPIYGLGYVRREGLTMPETVQGGDLIHEA